MQYFSSVRYPIRYLKKRQNILMEAVICLEEKIIMA